MGGLRYLLWILPVVLAAQSAKRPYWAFRSPEKPVVPAMAGVTNPIDAFLLTKLQAKNLDFSPRADQATLIRRAAFDLTGLPPAPEDLNTPYTEMVDRLLASPRYGERWGRHWLDVVRYGETDGGEHNYERMHAWPYRDYVIRSFNQDKPYLQFVREQLIGDLLAPNNPEMVAATGFLTAGPWDSVSAELNKDKTLKAQARMDELDDMVTTTFHTFQALTVNCARCHDHKFDPIPAKDYYKLTSVFAGVGFGTQIVSTPEERAAVDQKTKPLRTKIQELDREIGRLENPVRTRLLLAHYREFDRQRAAELSRSPINPIWNRNAFRALDAPYFRLVINSNQKGRPRIDQLDLLPGGPSLRGWQGEHQASDDKPVILEIQNPDRTQVSSIEWSADRVNGQRDGAILVYRLEASDDGRTWRNVCSSLDHVGRNELDLPQVSEGELVTALDAKSREARRRLIEERSLVQAELKKLPESPRVYATRPHEVSPAFLLDRGSVSKPKEEVFPGALTAISQLPADFSLPATAPDSDRRRALAAWIADAKNPLTARVMVNRVWYYHFGRGLVNTPSDFGVMGDRPSHPELLDWLAVSFLENGGSVKWLHRLILSSKAYQQSSAMNEKAFAIDGDNRLVWRMALRRMDAETLRDSILATSGKLNLEVTSGPGFFLQVKGDRGSYIYKAVERDGPELWRRAVYRFVVRGGERIMLDSFDCPDPSVSTPQRSVSNTPVQALTLLNNEFVWRQAGFLAERLQREGGNDPAGQVKRAYLLLVGRTPSESELKVARDFLNRQSLALFCRALYNTNEFLYVP